MYISFMLGGYTEINCFGFSKFCPVNVVSVDVAISHHHEKKASLRFGERTIANFTSNNVKRYGQSIIHLILPAMTRIMICICTVFGNTVEHEIAVTGFSIAILEWSHCAHDKISIYPAHAHHDTVRNNAFVFIDNL
jgi:hypothetical protein